MTIEIVDAGPMTTVRDFPGRVGYRAAGLPPAGPMDDLSFRLGNRALGNDDSCAGLEMAVGGVTLKFDAPAAICLAGAEMYASVDAEPVDFWVPVSVPPGGTVKIGRLIGGGARAYLLVGGGIDVPLCLGSRSVLTAGSALRPGDVLRTCPHRRRARAAAIPWEMRPITTGPWEIAVLDGPHLYPEFLTGDGVATFYGSDWEVLGDPDRSAVRLTGPKLGWARPDGKEAGPHPSNTSIGARAVGSVMFAGDAPVIVGPDGASLGRSVCPATVVAAELWKLGQLKAGDSVRFLPVTPEWAQQAADAREASIRDLYAEPVDLEVRLRTAPPAPASTRSRPGRPEVAYRRCGDRHLLVEFGPPGPDPTLRMWVQSLMEVLQAIDPPGIVDLVPGTGSLQVQVDGHELTPGVLQELLADLEADLVPPGGTLVPGRTVHLPLSWEDRHLEFIRRANGLRSIEELKEIVTRASYVVLSLGEGHPGAPVAAASDPGHRLGAARFSAAPIPAPESSVGVGGGFLSISGNKGHTPYLPLGRTVPVWNGSPAASQDRPWLLDFFDRIRFFPVTPDQLGRWRDGVILGTRELEIDPAPGTGGVGETS